MMVMMTTTTIIKGQGKEKRTVEFLAGKTSSLRNYRVN